MAAPDPRLSPLGRGKSTVFRMKAAGLGRVPGKGKQAKKKAGVERREKAEGRHSVSLEQTVRDDTRQQAKHNGKAEQRIGAEHS